MASISSSLALKDRFTSTINKAVQGTNRLLNAMEAVGDSKLDVNLQRQLRIAQKAVMETDDELKKMINDLNKAEKAANPLAGTMSKLFRMAAGGFVVKMGIDQTDLYTNNKARLSLINDGLQTQAELQQKIYAAAQRSRGEYSAMVDSVSKLAAGR